MFETFLFVQLCLNRSGGQWVVDRYKQQNINIQKVSGELQKKNVTKLCTNLQYTLGHPRHPVASVKWGFVRILY